MPFLPFEAIDSNGKTIRGTIQADNAQQLELILLQKGLRPVANPTPAQPARPMQVARPAPKPVSPPIQPIQPRSSSREAPVPAQRPISPVQPVGTQKTPELTYKQTFFLFTQFASFFRAGFSSSQMIQQATLVMPEKFRPHFAEMEQEVAQGMTLSESMSRRPMLFHPDQVATVQAGEQSGHMAEAFDVLAQQGERGGAFRVAFGYFFIVFPILLLCGVGGIGLQKASQSTIQKQFDADGQLDRVGTLLAEIKTRLPHEFLLALVLAVGFIAFVKILHKFPFRKFRHKAGLMVPVSSSRAKSEAIERFTWAMSTMLQGGASPASAVHIAAASIPNLVLRERALQSIGAMKENEPLGSVLQRSGLLSTEYVHMVQNGEMVGDTPGALTHISRAETDQFQARTTGLKVVISASTMLFMALFTAIMVGFLYYMYASGMVKMLNNVQ